MPETPVIKRCVDRYGRVIKSIEVEWKSICEREGCSNEARDVHHYNYERVGKERIGPDPEACITPEPDGSEVEDVLAHLMAQNDLIALCRNCHTALHAEEKII